MTTVMRCPWWLSPSWPPPAWLDVDGLQCIDGHAHGVGANTSLMIPLVGGKLGTPTTLVADAHSLGLEVHVAIGNMQGQVRAFTALGMDGFFTDQPDLGVSAVPEPGTWALLAAGLAGLGWRARRVKRRA